MSYLTRLALVASVALAGCDDPTASRPAGRYAAQVTGGLERTLQGAADVVMGRSGYGTPTLSLELGGEGAADHISLVIARDAVPAIGVYEIAAFSTEPPVDRWIAVYAVVNHDETSGFFAAIGGIVRITHSSPGRVQGTFVLDAEGALDDPALGPVVIVIEGTLDAWLASR